MGLIFIGFLVVDTIREGKEIRCLRQIMREHHEYEHDKYRLLNQPW